MTSQADFHLDTGAVALGALPDDELAQVQAHLETCESCTTELAGFRETVAMLGAVSAETPPASLRSSIMARIAVTPQLPPLVTPAESSPSPAEPAVPAAAEGTSDATPTTETTEGTPNNVVPIRRWFRRPGALIAAAVAAVVIGGGAVVAINQAGGPGTQVAQTPEECIAQAADKELITPAAGNEGSVTYAASCSAVLLDVTGLPALPADKTYQLWALKGQEARSLEPLPAATAGESELVTRSTLPGENAVAITVEPAGGSKQPTLPIVWQAALT